MEEQLRQTEQFRKSHVPPRNILRFFREQNVDCAIRPQASLEFSRTKDTFNAKSNPILRTLVDIEAFCKTLEIGECHSSARQHDMYFDIRYLTDLLHQISTYRYPNTGTISKAREMRRSAKRVLSSVLPEDPIQKSSRFGFGSGSGSGSGSCSGSRGRGRLLRAPRNRGRRRSHSRSSLSSVIDPSPCFTFSYTNAFPTFIYPFIDNWKNVIGDGNCGYRVGVHFVFVMSINCQRTQWQDGLAPIEALVGNT
ncbi:hypothetical protein M9H77_09551 [Catharanthus roseus]|uniref:Uncharacterized protein n=1 Tax=Catharanthus roseus TaxID=4058 RepID=A0ACC0C0Z2_CATRO|nr:hypothetical protein M9H77_09551 [Catharanthus roseus]